MSKNQLKINQLNSCFSKKNIKVLIKIERPTNGIIKVKMKLTQFFSGRCQNTEMQIKKTIKKIPAWDSIRIK